MEVTFKFPLVLFSVFLSISQIFGKDLNYTIPEEEEPNYPIGNIREDFNLSSYFVPSNQQEYNNLKYSILSQGNPHAAFFSINEQDSSLYTRQKLDRESLKHCEFSLICELSIDVIAKSTVGTFFKKIKVKIFLRDINDNSPTFSVNATHLEVSESYVLGSPLSIDGAVDRDSGVNSVQSYRILEQNVPFSVEFNKYVDGSSSVKIIVEEKLDSESKNFYQLHVLAVDGGSPPQTGTLLVNISVLDVNDNAPEFDHSLYNVTIREDMPVNTIIMNVSASDLDSGLNGQVVYGLSPHQPDVIRTLFAIDEVTGSLRLIKGLVYMPGEQYQVIVEASDMAAKPLFTQATIFVNVNDSSNDRPEINVNLLSNADVAKISENANLGAAVAHIGVTDDDMGQNGNVTCHVQSEYFTLDPLNKDEYKVVVNKALNRETVAEHDVTIVCIDHGIPPMNSSETFKVKVLDENDHVPKFSKWHYRTTMEENNPLGKSLITVTATDLDIGINAEVEYSINNSEPYNFSIDKKTGVISVDSYLDRETVTMLVFQVQAKDKGTPSQTGTASVIVNISDANDNKPKFDKSVYMFNVTENVEGELMIGRVHANDSDVGENGTVVFQLSPQSSSDLPFKVLANGSIYSKRPLNRESMPHGYNFNVFALDRGSPPQTSIAHVTVFVEDENDNEPVIQFPTYDNKTVRVYYDIPMDVAITQVIAVDPDVGGNSKLTYTIVQDDILNIFSIDFNTGEIFLSRPLTEADINTYTFTIKVEDHGVPRKSALEDITIIVTSPLLPGGQSGLDQNLLIIIIITCVTIVLSVAIILVICLIRKMDRTKKPKYAQKSESNHQNHNGTLNVNGDLYDGIDRNANEKKQPGEKKVSFSMDSNPLSIIAATEERSGFNTAKLGVDEVSIILLKHLHVLI